MPQMMPLMWMLMILSSIILLISISSFIYFFHQPVTLELLQKSSKFNIIKWNWKW